MKSVIITFNSIRAILGSLKAWFKINFLYGYKYHPGSVQSLIPDTLKLGRSPVIEENIYFSSTIKKIGNECFIGCRSVINNCSEIGDFSSISKDVKIGMDNHPLDRMSTSPRFYLKKYGRVEKDRLTKMKPTIIKDDVLISSNVIVLSGITIGRGSVLAAGAIVTKDVEPYSIVGGVPAKHIRYRINKELQNKYLTLNFEDEALLRQFNEPNL